MCRIVVVGSTESMIQLILICRVADIVVFQVTPQYRGEAWKCGVVVPHPRIVAATGWSRKENPRILCTVEESN
jgi:hypothetical protein